MPKPTKTKSKLKLVKENRLSRAVGRFNSLMYKLTARVQNIVRGLSLTHVTKLQAVIGLALAGVLLYAGYQSTARVKIAYIKHTLKRSVVMLTPESGARGGGTGFNIVVGKRTYIVSNEHVCEMGEESGAVLVHFEGNTHRIRILKTDPTIDLCLLEGVASPYRLPKLAEDSVALGEQIYIGGHPRLNPLVLSSGAVIGQGVVGIGGRADENDQCKPGQTRVDLLFYVVCVRNIEVVITSATVYPGNSGSPVLNSDGRVVGVINSGDTRTNYGNYIPLRHLKQFIAEYE